MEINRAKISAVLSGEMQTHELTPAEQTAWLDAFTEKMAHETAAESARTGVIRTGIPIASGHAFQSDPDSYSGVSGQAL